DEQRRDTQAVADPPAAPFRGILDRARRGCTDRNDPAPLRARGIDRIGRRRWNFVSLPIDDVLLDDGAANGFEGAVADVKRDLHRPDASRLEGFEDLRREMQSRGGRGDRAPYTREDRLISLSIGRRVVTLDVGRQRYMTERVDERLDIGVRLGPQADRAAA